MRWGRGRLEEAPMYTVDIDTGGTMTDGLVSDGTELLAIKVDTTPHDYTVSFRQVLAEAARQLGFGERPGRVPGPGLGDPLVVHHHLERHRRAQGRQARLAGAPGPRARPLRPGSLAGGRHPGGRARPDRAGRGCATSRPCSRACGGCSRTGRRRICVALDTLPRRGPGAAGQEDRRAAVPRPLPRRGAGPAGQRDGPGGRRRDPRPRRGDQRLRAQPAGVVAVQGRGPAAL